MSLPSSLWRRWWGPLAALSVVAADRVSKLCVASSMELWSSRTIVPGFFDLVHSQNRGMAFGLLNDGATHATRLLLIAVSIAVLAFLVQLTLRAWRDTGDAVPVPLFLVLGGAIGNLWDRVQHGYVVDFLDFHLGGWSWPAFNVADSAITIGALWLLWEMWSPRRVGVEKRS